MVGSGTELLNTAVKAHMLKALCLFQAAHLAMRDRWGQ